MIDKIDAYYLPEPDEKIYERDLTKLEKYKKKSKGSYTEYKVRNIRIRVFRISHRPISRITLRGSLLTFLYKNNLRNYNMIQIKMGVGYLKNFTGLPIQEFIITKIEIGANLKMKKPVMDYIKLLEYLPYAKLKPYKKEPSIRFENTARTVKIYDKGKHLREKFSKTLKSYDDTTNILRFEVKIEKVPYEFKRPVLTIEDLYKYPSVYTQFESIWKNHYYRIHKKHNVDLKKLSKPSDISLFLMKEGLDAIGGKQKLHDELKKYVRNGEMPKHYPSVIMNQLTNLRDSPIAKPNELINELDEKVENMEFIYRTSDN